MIPLKVIFIIIFQLFIRRKIFSKKILIIVFLFFDSSRKNFISSVTGLREIVSSFMRWGDLIESSMNASNLIDYIIQFQFGDFRQNLKAMVKVPYFIFLFIYILSLKSNVVKTFDNNIIIRDVERVWVRLWENCSRE